MMYRSNDQMAPWLSKAMALPRKPISHELARLIGDEIVSVDDAFIFKSLVPTNFRLRPRQIDRTDFECRTNHIHFTSVTWSESVNNVLQLFSVVSGMWYRCSAAKGDIIQIVSFGTSFTNSNSPIEFIYRFHVQREEPAWLSPDLNSYVEPILVCQSSNEDKST